jgi:uncharacterized protein YodC (DUF2158 family)
MTERFELVEYTWLRPGNLVRHKTGGPVMMIEWETGADAFGRDAHCLCVWVENGARRFATFHRWTLQPVHADGSPRRYDAEPHLHRQGAMTFRRFDAGSMVSFLPWVRDMETGLEIRQTTRRMSVGKVIFVGRRDDRIILFSFDASYRYDDEKKQDIYSAPMEKVTEPYHKNMSDLPEFKSEEEFIAKLRQGIELMFTGAPERWGSVHFDLTSDVARR